MGDTLFSEIKDSRSDLEFNKFVPDSTGKVAICTILDTGEISNLCKTILGLLFK